jgi:hypothetical protein
MSPESNMSNTKEQLPGIVWRHVRCLDPDLEDGGVRGVVYNLRMEKIEF